LIAKEYIVKFVNKKLWVVQQPHSTYFRAESVRQSTADSRIAVHVLADRNALRNPLRNMHQPL